MNPEAPSSARRPGWFATGAALFVLLASLYLITTTGRFRLDDEHILAARAQSLALRGEADQPQVLGNSRVRALEAMGDQATQLEPLLPLLSGWIYRGAIWAGVGGAQALFFLNPFVTAATALIVLVTVIVLDGSRRAAVWTALLFGAGTLAWPYATTLLRDSLAMACAAVAFLGMALLVRSRSNDRLYGLLLVAVGLTAGALSKNTIVAVALGLGTTAFLTSLVHVRSSRIARWTVAGIVGAGLAAVGLLAVIPSTGPLARYSLAYYTFLSGHFLESLTPALLLNALGPFVSPAKSLFLFSPPALLAIAGSAGGNPGVRRIAPYAWAGAASLAIAQALFYREQWAGPVGYGLRFMLPALPLLLVVGSPVVDRLLESGRRWTKGALVTLLAVSAVFQLAGSVVDWNRIYATWLHRGLDPFQAGSAWDGGFLSIPAQVAWLGNPSTWSLVWPRLASAGVVAAWVSPIAALIVAVAAVLILARRQGPTRESKSRRVVPLLLLASWIPLTYLTLRLAAGDRAFGGGRPEIEAVFQLWRAEGRTSDRVLVDSYATPLWAAFMNRWTSAAVWMSLPYDIPDPSEGGLELSAHALEILEAAEASGGRIWYVTSSDSPGAALQREVRWLDDHDRRVLSADYVGETRVTVRIYCNCGP